MSVYGTHPADHFFLVVCEHCKQVVKPQALAHHINIHHRLAADVPDDDQAVAEPFAVASPTGAVPTNFERTQLDSVTRKSKTAAVTSETRSGRDATTKSPVNGSIKLTISAAAGICKLNPPAPPTPPQPPPLSKLSATHDQSSPEEPATIDDAHELDDVSQRNVNVPMAIGVAPAPAELPTLTELQPVQLAAVAEPVTAGQPVLEPVTEAAVFTDASQPYTSQPAVNIPATVETLATNTISGTNAASSLITTFTQNTISSSTVALSSPTLTTLLDAAPSASLPTAAALATADPAAKKAKSGDANLKKPKKVPAPVNAVPREKLLPCKDREYDADKHCGVLLQETGRPCTRSLTCKTHSLSLRRQVQGRSRTFDELLSEHRALKEAALRLAGKEVKLTKKQLKQLAADERKKGSSNNANNVMAQLSDSQSSFSSSTSATPTKVDAVNNTAISHTPPPLNAQQSLLAPQHLQDRTPKAKPDAKFGDIRLKSLLSQPISVVINHNSSSLNLKPWQRTTAVPSSSPTVVNSNNKSYSLLANNQVQSALPAARPSAIPQSQATCADGLTYVKSQPKPFAVNTFNARTYPLTSPLRSGAGGGPCLSSKVFNTRHRDVPYSKLRSLISSREQLPPPPTPPPDTKPATTAVNVESIGQRKYPVPPAPVLATTLRAPTIGAQQ